MPYKKAAMIAGSCAFLIGTVYFISWMTGAMTYRGFQVITIKTNASLCLILCGLAAIFTVPEHPRQAIVWSASTLATVALIIGGATVVEHIAGWDFGIDQFLATEPPGALSISHPNRMGPPGAVSFTLCGAAILLLLRGTSSAVRSAQGLGVVMCGIALLGMLGYLYDVKGLYGAAQYTAIAWPTTVAIFLLGTAVLFCRPDGGSWLPLPPATVEGSPSGGSSSPPSSFRCCSDGFAWLESATACTSITLVPPSWCSPGS